MIALNRAIALAEVGGAEAGLEAIRQIQGSATVNTYHFFYATRAELIQAVQGVRAALPDIKPTLPQTVVEGDLVSVRVVAQGTHTGAPFPPGIPASGKSITWKEVHIFRCQDGQIVEHWGVFDMLGILQQLGAIPG